MGPNSFVCLATTPWEVTCDVFARCQKPALLFAKASLSDPWDMKLSSIGELISVLESNLAHDDDRAVAEPLYAEESNPAACAQDFQVWPREVEPGTSMRPGCPCPSCRRNAAALHGDEGTSRMPEVMREIFEQRLEHLHKMKETHIEIEVGEEYCLIFRDPTLPPDNEVCQYCLEQTYLALPRKGAQWFAAGNSKRDRAEEKKSPIDHLSTPYRHVSARSPTLE